jgi:hypothetical protein
MGEVSSEIGEKLYFDTILHDDGNIGYGGQMVDLIGPPGVGKSTLIMQMAQFTRHLDYDTSKEDLIKMQKKKQKAPDFPETVIMRGLSSDHWNCLIPKNWKKSFPNYGKPKFLVIHVHEDDNYGFYEVSPEKKQKINRELNIKPYKDAEELFDNIRPKAINIVYEPSKYFLTQKVIDTINISKLKKPNEKEENDNISIPAPPVVFWFEFIEFLCRNTRGAFCTLIIDEFHLVARAYLRGDLFHMVAWLAETIIDMRKNNISFFISTHDENLIDYRITERIVKKIWFKGAVPKNSRVKLSLVSSLDKIGTAIIEQRNVEFGTLPFDKFKDAPPLLKAYPNGV